MRKRMQLSARMYALLVLCLFITIPCTAQADAEPESIVLSETRIIIDLAEEDTALLSGSVLPPTADQEIDWKTDDRDIARISNGKVYGREVGTTFITATSEEDETVTSVCEIVVIDSDIPESIVLSPESITLDLAGTKTASLKATALPAVSNQSVRWKTSSSSIVKVSSSGVITARKTGTAVITATSKESSEVYGQCVVTVIDSDIPEQIVLNRNEVTLDLANPTEVALQATALPSIANQDVDWETSSSSIVRVNSSGKLTARKVGTATIRAESEESSKIYGECVVKVIDSRIPTDVRLVNIGDTLSMERYQTIQLHAIAEPSYADQDVKWKTSKSSIVSVSSSGVLTAKKAGTATITCYSERSSSVKAVVEVTVIQHPSPEHIELKPADTIMVLGDTLQLTPIVSPADEKVCEYFNWKTSSSRTASVDSNGLVTAKKTGWVTITCESKQNSRIKATRKILIVSETSPHYIRIETQDHPGAWLNDRTITLNPTDTLQLNVNVLPEGKNSEVTWKSGSTSRATVSSTGLVTAKKAGTVTITATSKANKEVKASFKLNIVNLPAPDSVELSAPVSTIEVWETLQLNAVTYPLDEKRSKEFKWSTSSSSIAKVSSTGLVTPQKTGTVTITVKSSRDSDVKDTFVLKIIDSKMPDSVELAESGTISIENGQKLQLNASVKPATAVQTLKWSTSSSSRVKVDANGVVTGVKSGTATVTVTSTYSKYRSDSVKIKVVTKAAPTALSLTAAPQTILAGNTTRLTPVPTPTNASVLGTYTSSNPAIATVDPDGVVTGHKPGTAVITLTSLKNSKIKATIPIVVYDENTPGSISLSSSMIYMVKGDEKQLTASILPATAPQSVTWSSSDSDIVRVDKDGTLKARNIGTAVISAKTTNGLTARCQVSVTSVYVATEIPARTTPVSGIAENLKKIKDIQDSAKSQVVRLVMNDQISSSESAARQQIIDRAFEMQAFPWMTKNVQAYWTSKYAYKQYEPGKVYYGLPYIQKNLKDSYDNREYDVAKAIKEERYVDSGNGYYWLNQSNLLGKMYVGNDCSSFMGISQYGINHPAAFIRTKYLMTSSYYETIAFSAMRPGDLLVMGENHTVMFLYWVDAAQTKMMIIEQGGDGNTVICSIHDLAYYSSQGYIARRRADFN